MHEENDGKEEMGRIKGREGLVTTPDGPAREIPSTYVWSERTLITKDGCAWKRYYNVWTQEWRWGEQPLEMTMDENGKVGFYANRSNLVSVEEAICLAWRKRAEDSKKPVCIVDGTEGGHADNLRWGEEEGGEPTVEGRESWKPLTKFCVGIVPVGPGYEISSHGRLRCPSGEVTAGFWFADRRWSAVKDVGLVDLSTASGLRKPTLDLKPVMIRAAECMLAGFSPEEYAMDSGVEVGTAWTYFCKGAEKVHPSDLMKVGPKLVCKDLWKALRRLDRDGDPILGMRLLDLMAKIDEMVPEDGAFRQSEHQYAQLRFGRLILQKC